jgi:hypothetical protein
MGSTSFGMGQVEDGIHDKAERRERQMDDGVMTSEIIIEIYLFSALNGMITSPL